MWPFSMWPVTSQTEMWVGHWHRSVRVERLRYLSNLTNHLNNRSDYLPINCLYLILKKNKKSWSAVSRKAEISVRTYAEYYLVISGCIFKSDVVSLPDKHKTSSLTRDANQDKTEFVASTPKPQNS